MRSIVILTCSFLILFAASAWCWYRSRPSAPEPEDRPWEPDSFEGALVVQLLRHEITERQYQEAMSGLAERDAVRHPLTLPPDL